MYTIFITGTAGSGKSLLTSRLLQWYKDNQLFPIGLNLDPGATNLPYEVDVDVRDYIDINTLMDNYALGPIVDTPGQIELFAFRPSGPYFVSNFQSDNKATIFVFDSMLVSSPINYVSIALLAASVKLRLKTSQINILTKSDLILEKLRDILEWSDSYHALEFALNNQKETEYSLLSKDLVRSMSKGGFMQNLIAVSSITMSGMVNLTASLSRILHQGESRY
jgi:GTPase SAR1 family protein